MINCAITLHYIIINVWLQARNDSGGTPCKPVQRGCRSPPAVKWLCAIALSNQTKSCKYIDSPSNPFSFPLPLQFANQTLPSATKFAKHGSLQICNHHHRYYTEEESWCCALRFAQRASEYTSRTIILIGTNCFISLPFILKRKEKYHHTKDASPFRSK
jgi:hypothetical protein